VRLCNAQPCAFLHAGRSQAWKSCFGPAKTTSEAGGRRQRWEARVATRVVPGTELFGDQSLVGTVCPALQKSPEACCPWKSREGAVGWHMPPRKAIYGIQLQKVTDQIFSPATIHTSSFLDLVLCYNCALEHHCSSSFFVFRGLAFSRKSKGGAGTVLALTEPDP
jgi:hypothetical protein